MNIDWEDVVDRILGIVKGLEESHVQTFDQDGATTKELADIRRMFVTVANSDSAKQNLKSYSYLIIFVEDGAKSKIDIKIPDVTVIGDLNFNKLLVKVDLIRTVGKHNGVTVHMAKFNRDIEPKFGLLREQVELMEYFSSFDVELEFLKKKF